MSAFFSVYSGLDREGPGCPEDVLWALEVAGTPDRARICDAGCGSGADSATLAEARRDARIVSVEQAEPLAREAKERLARFGARVETRQNDMARLDGAFDLIWCAGALYFLGVTEGLSGWRSNLAPGGAIAFSEPCAIAGAETGATQRFWADYPALTDLAGIEARVRAAGFAPLGHRIIVGPPWARYYASLERRIAALRKGRPDAEVRQVLDAAEAEIAAWRQAPEAIAYALLVVRPE
ncbi:class I SAM-dependent methyltransferase [Sulfitobacter sp. D35]|uniref:class I SAM-dependent methyltransferase n=1 Tax=Sulfitobacter sp. D35 TaxID=3083252 RepID=UPI00296E6004|nr:class I SAM-dependent methyltransferase [Sulfitobacter sp. D35]MDW4497563.1 class I SAM-dependent methyltransferase [Sulfitobacter sp. D35]